MMGCSSYWVVAGAHTDLSPGKNDAPSRPAHAGNARELPQRRALDGEVALLIYSLRRGEYN